jgi:transcriptional regulator with XRE-family HTH domain
MEKSVHTPEYAALRAALHDARKRAGLTQRQLASRLDVPHSWVAKVESGERRIDLVEFGWFVAACDADLRRVAGRLLEQIWARRAGRFRKGGQSL